MIRCDKHQISFKKIVTITVVERRARERKEENLLQKNGLLHSLQKFYQPGVVTCRKGRKSDSKKNSYIQNKYNFPHDLRSQAEENVTN